MIAELEQARYDAGTLANETLQTFLDAKPRTLQKRGAAKKLGECQAEIVRITRELERADPDWRAAGLSSAMIKNARIWYPLQNLPVPEFAAPPRVVSRQTTLLVS